ncbi:hypothetical protein AMATHDRAFT_39973 [Amanita thiersii Skay4041]|uniref:Uncharacterized protein n=1 Tax=Amanita thiersii Skay4041 TaxID=703135 RepID=A0A2A9NVJ2_9AGAR|nr:hypothetical protein AMATHDRAFT_39973 [Amanita thiersii Skay4041]
MRFFATVLLVSFSVVGVHNQPVTNEERSPGVVWVPKILTPNAHTHWRAGHVETVTWDTSDQPDIITNVGHVVLRFVADMTGPFNLAEQNGSIAVQVPDVKPGRYQIVLFGDSGNFSPFFHIKKH